jgi:amino acid transporter
MGFNIGIQVLPFNIYSIRMKKNLVTIFSLFVIIFISVAATFNYPKFLWTETTHDFGEIKCKQPVSYEFEFTNKGQGFLVISNVEASCGCTVTEYTKNPVPPNGKGKVKATYDAINLGVFNKSITVTANVEGGPEYLYIKGTVKE